MSQGVRTRPEGSEQALSEAYDTALLDLDGVVYAGGNAIAHAVESLATARAGGMRLAYVTNNALRTPDTVAEHLTELGIPTGARDVITSAQAVARLIAEQVPPGARVLVIGGEGLRVALRERGLEPVESADDDPAAVVQGFGGPDLPWARLAEACVRGRARGAVVRVQHRPDDSRARAGSRRATARRWRSYGSRPVPSRRWRASRCRRCTGRRCCGPGAERPLVVGDRLDTDIEGAFNGGVDSLLVLTGVTDGAQLLAAPPQHRPTYVDADLRGLLTGQPEVSADGQGFRCGGWTAKAGAVGASPLERGPERGRLELDGDGEALDGLRALCAAAWTAAGDGVCELDGGKALARLGL